MFCKRKAPMLSLRMRACGQHSRGLLLYL